MKGLKKAASQPEFKWSDIVLDPPATRNKRERRILNQSTLIGGGLGTLGGVGIGKKWHDRANQMRDKPIPYEPGDLGSHALGGGTAGAVLGSLVGNYRIFKDRQERGEPEYDEHELEHEDLRLRNTPQKRLPEVAKSL